MLSRYCMMMLIGLLAAGFVVAPASAQDAPAADEGAQVEVFDATVTGVEGMVQVRLAEDQPWQKAEVGMVVGNGAEFRTGPRSAVRFTIPPAQVITLDRLGTVKVLQAVRDQGGVKTDIGMEYGRTRFDIERGGEEHDVKIHSPGAVLAVRGPVGSMYNQRPFKSVFRSITGQIEANANRKSQKMGGDKDTQATEGSTPAEDGIDLATVDPGFARDETEEGIVASKTLLAAAAGGGFAGGGDLRNTGEDVFNRDDMNELPDVGNNFTLAFGLAWNLDFFPTGVEGMPAAQNGTIDLDIYIMTPNGNVLMTKGAMPVDGGRVLFDDVGDGMGDAGEFGNLAYSVEVATFDNGHDGGTYQFGARYNAYNGDGDAPTVNFTAFAVDPRDENVPTFTDTLDMVGQVKTNDVTVPASD